MVWTLVGVDCGTLEQRTGLAYGALDEGGDLELKRATLGTAGESPAATIAGFIGGAAQYIVAMDAPLGWPAGLRTALAKHRAGMPIELEAEQLFRRGTDRFVRAAFGKLPLEVGADRVARTSRAALELLGQTRSAMNGALPLAWKPSRSSGAIEVLPAATLLSRGIAPGGYKVNNAAGRNARMQILERLRSEFHTTLSAELLVDDPNILDAVVCVLAAADFASGHVIAPKEKRAARREGWIWFRGTGQRDLF